MREVEHLDRRNSLGIGFRDDLNLARLLFSLELRWIERHEERD